MSSSGILRGGTALALVLAAAPALAQSEDSFTLDPLVIEGSKREVATGTAAPVTVIDETEIRDRQAGTIAELIDSVPGVALVNGSTPTGSGISIRGYGATSTYGTDQKVQVIVDEAITGSEEIYRLGTQLFTDPALYRSVEVLRGTVGSFEYGSGIVGGVVKAETKNASDFTGGVPGFRLRETLEYSSNGDGFATSTILAWQPTDRAEFLANYTLRKQDAQVDGSGTTIGNSQFETPSWLLKGRVYLDEAKEHSLTLSYTDTSTAERDVPYDSFDTSGGMFGNVDRDIDSRTATLVYNFAPQTNPLIDFDVILSYADQQIDQSYIPGSSDAPFAPPGGFPTVNADHRYETTRLAFKNTARFGTGMVDHELRTGLEFIRKERESAESAPGGTDRRVALYAIDEMRFGNWTVTPALRYETQEIEDGTGFGGPDTYDNDALMGGISARYAFANGVSLFASAAYTESLPILDDLYGTDRGMSGPVAQRELMSTSEKSHTFELGGAYDAAVVFGTEDELAFKATAYATTLWDVTSYTVPDVTGVHVDEVETHGLELEASYSMESGFYSDLNLAVARGEESYPGGLGDADWRALPGDSARLTLGKRFGDTLDMSWEVVAFDDIEVDDDETPGFSVHNLRATYTPQEGVLAGTEMRFGLENAFDRDYQPRRSTRRAPGRNFKVSLAKTF
ncbi:TonB-dependent receptor domain-containing protein [Roseivivax sediminis]|uniref:Hemoglobin/transferrin/lactoferrin receptor protein n=1 Tax=Roseivivax sediminis TaxID=936889 RepID=A0A1I2D268_9RHOB|nr:TonB-dependent receptor [Roseivivax sediminis]SFE74647.1 hemoglobin/transferrin/lactoferrin receptor protein [Roseivivax sediminis]